MTGNNVTCSEEEVKLNDLVAGLPHAALALCSRLQMDPNEQISTDSPLGTFYFMRWQLFAESVMEGLKPSLPAKLQEEFVRRAIEAILPRNVVLH